MYLLSNKIDSKKDTFYYFSNPVFLILVKYNDDGDSSFSTEKVL